MSFITSEIIKKAKASHYWPFVKGICWRPTVYWPLVREIHLPPLNSSHRGLWHRALLFSLMFSSCAPEHTLFAGWPQYTRNISTTPSYSIPTRYRHYRAAWHFTSPAIWLFIQQFVYRLITTTWKPVLLPFLWGIHKPPLDYPLKGPVTPKILHVITSSCKASNTERIRMWYHHDVYSIMAIKAW